MKNFNSKLAIVTAVAVSLAGCGGSKPSGNNTGAKLVDPSGNWTMTANDGQHSTNFAALFNQTGATVTANSFTAPNNANLTCVPFSAALSNGNVGGADGNLFTGNVTISNSQTQVAFGTFGFSGTLTPDGLSVSGTYSAMPACAGVAATGAFTGSQVPSTSGNWTGTIQPCNYDSHPLPGETPYQDCLRNATGSPAPVSMTLTQNDATGDVTGTYTTAASPFSGGNVVVLSGSPVGFLSGLSWQFDMSDNAKFTGVCFGSLGMDRSFKGLVTDVQTSTYYALTMSH